MYTALVAAIDKQIKHFKIERLSYAQCWEMIGIAAPLLKARPKVMDQMLTAAIEVQRQDITFEKEKEIEKQLKHKKNELFDEVEKQLDEKTAEIENLVEWLETQKLDEDKKAVIVGILEEKLESIE